jgi:hypothetical protein
MEHSFLFLVALISLPRISFEQWYVLNIVTKHFTDNNDKIFRLFNITYQNTIVATLATFQKYFFMS